MHQKHYIKKLQQIPLSSKSAEFKSLRAILAWASNTRPNIFCAVAKLVQVTEKAFDHDTTSFVKSADKIVRHLQGRKKMVLNFPKLDKKTLCLQAYSDASFASNYNLSSQLGYFIF